LALHGSDNHDLKFGDLKHGALPLKPAEVKNQVSSADKTWLDV
jgi:hypothetical protein